MPVNIDNPNPLGSGGLTGASQAINFNPNVLQEVSVSLGSADNGNAIQTITLGGTPSSGTFEIIYTNTTATSSQTTGPITYSAVPSTLAGNIQSALTALSLVVRSGVQVVALNASTYAVTFVGAQGSKVQQPISTTAVSLGAGNTATAALTAQGFTAWNISPPSVDNTRGLLGVAEGTAGAPNTNSVGGSLILITFLVKANAPGGLTPIYLAQQVTPVSLTVTTSLAVANSNYLGLGGTLPVRPGVTEPVTPVGNVPNNPFPSFVNGVDGVVTIAAYFSINTPSTAAAGTPFTFTITAFGANNLVNTGYNGTVVFSSTDGSANFVPPQATLVNGVGVFTATLNTTGNQLISATDSVAPTINGTSNPIVVTSVGNQDHFVVIAPSGTTAGGNFTYTVTAENANGVADTTYAGTVTFTSSDGQGVLPAGTTLVNGQGTFSATLKTAGSQTLTAADTTSTTITAGTATITVSAAAATHFAVAAPGTATAGIGIPFTVTAEDQFNNVATTYGGNVMFTSTDVGAATLLPANSGLTNGMGTFSATLTTAGTQTLIATDSVTSSITGASGPIVVSAASATHFVVTAPGTATAGVGVPFTVKAEDQFNNVATTYGGMVAFSSSDHGAATVLPANSGLTNGVGTFNATLTTAGSQILTATDSVTSSITGASGPIVVSAATASHFLAQRPGTATAGIGVPFTVTAEDKFNNVATTYAGLVAFTSSDHGASTVLPGNSGLTNGVGMFNATLTTAGTQTLTATDSVTSSITGASGPIVVSAATATHFIVTAPASVGGDTGFAFTVRAEDQFNNTATSYGGSPTFTSSDTGAFLPAASPLTNGLGTFSATLETQGTQTITATDGSITGTSNNILVAPSK